MCQILPRYIAALCVRTALLPEEGGSGAGQGQSDSHPGQVGLYKYLGIVWHYVSVLPPPPEEGGSRAGQGQSDYHPGQVARGGSFILRYFDSVPVFRIHFPFKRIPVQPKSQYGSGVPNPCFYATLSETTKHFFQQLPLP